MSKQMTLTGKKSIEPREQDIMNEVKKAMMYAGLKLVDRRNSGCFKTKNGFVYGCMKGTPDLFGIDEHACAYFVEVKRQDGKTSPEQEKYISNAKSCGAFAEVVRSPEEFIEKLKSFRTWKYGDQSI